MTAFNASYKQSETRTSFFTRIMGCSPSKRSQKSDGLRLMGTKLFFTGDQLRILNTYFRKTIKEESIDAQGG